MAAVRYASEELSKTTTTEDGKNQTTEHVPDSL